MPYAVALPASHQLRFACIARDGKMFALDRWLAICASSALLVTFPPGSEFDDPLSGAKVRRERHATLFTSPSTGARLEVSYALGYVCTHHENASDLALLAELADHMSELEAYPNA